MTVVDRAGVENELDLAIGDSVMEGLRNAGYDDLLALCGGCLSCATCHVYVDGGGAAALPPCSEDEYDLLETSEHKMPSSRLSCQIIVTGELEGLRVTIAPED